MTERLQLDKEQRSAQMFAPRGAADGGDDCRKIVSIQLRIDRSHADMLQTINERRNSDRADTLRYLIRLGFIAYMAKDTKVVLTDPDGSEYSIQMVKNGVSI